MMNNSKRNGWFVQFNQKSNSKTTKNFIKFLTKFLWPSYDTWDRMPSETEFRDVSWRSFPYIYVYSIALPLNTIFQMFFPDELGWTNWEPRDERTD